jgi:hypothetical protein
LTFLLLWPERRMHASVGAGTSPARLGAEHQMRYKRLCHAAASPSPSCSAELAINTVVSACCLLLAVVQRLQQNMHSIRTAAYLYAAADCADAAAATSLISDA